jgi:SulP family sulfate permease
VPAIDLNASASLRALARAIKARGATLHLAELRDDVAEGLRKTGAEDDLGPVTAHLTIEQCLAGGRDSLHN